ncbi:MAG: Hsp20/alpha crystallin family protein [Chitinophagaceae bacterium]|nr:Hsp20/alpha crystallin family protein [Chitinophagaceae bacterium]
MTLVKHNYRQLNNLFDEFFNSFPANWNRDNNWQIPPVNIQESNDAYNLELVAPGLRKEDFKVNLERGLLTISFEKKGETETTNNETKTHRKEFHLNSFKRSFTVDDKIDAEKIEARYENGILKLWLPKKEEVKVMPKEIAIL